MFVVLVSTVQTVSRRNLLAADLCRFKTFLSIRRVLIRTDWPETTRNEPLQTEQELSYRKQIARQLLTQYVEGIYRSNYP